MKIYIVQQQGIGDSEDEYYNFGVALTLTAAEALIKAVIDEQDEDNDPHWNEDEFLIEEREIGYSDFEVLNFRDGAWVPVDYS